MKLNAVFDTDDEVQFLTAWAFKRDKVQIDNIAFYLHYHVTTTLLFVGCLIVTIGMYIMDPIDCIADKAVDDVIDNYCLYHSTYTIFGENQDALSVHPGVPGNNPGGGSSESRFHNYYLWVAIVLAIQAGIFYIPRGLWKGWEGARVQTLLNQKSELFSEERDQNVENSAESDEIDNKWHRLALYIASRRHKSYYCRLFTCEFLNLVTAILTLMITDLFLGYGFSNLNFEVLNLMQDGRPFERTDVVEQLFPKVSACTFYTYGPSGNVVNYQALCVLPINALNEKIFCILYVWFVLLISVSFLALLYRLLFLIAPFRKAILMRNINYNEITSSNVDLSDLNGKALGIGNLQLLFQLGGNNNMDSSEFTRLVISLCEQSKRVSV